MRRRGKATLALAAAAVLTCAACGGGSGADAGADLAGPVGASSSVGARGGVRVGVVLPDTRSSARWESFDKPLLQKAFDDAGIRVDIRNALGDTAAFASAADAMIKEGVRVLIIANIDNASGAQVQAKAKAAGVATIDYDRLTLGGSADYYVSFDNVKVGELQGAGLVTCLGARAGARIIELNGSPTDNNATLFKQGYDSQLAPRYAAGWKKVGDRSVPKWDAAQAGTVFQQLLVAAGTRVDGVLVANDGMAQSVIARLRAAHVKAPVTGQDATPEGLRSVLLGEQCMTVYKAVALEAVGAAGAATALIRGGSVDTGGKTTRDAVGRRDVPSVLLAPQPVTAATVKDVVADGFVRAGEICTTDEARAACAKYGVQ